MMRACTRTNACRLLLATTALASAAAAACPETAHYGDREAANRLTLHGAGGERHFHFDRVAVVHRRISANDTGLEVRLPRLIDPDNDWTSYLWPRHAERYEGGTGTFAVYETAMLQQRMFGCFELPPDDYTTSTFQIERWQDPRAGDGRLVARIERTNADGLGYTVQLDTDNVIALTTQPVKGEMFVKDEFSGEVERHAPDKGYFLYMPGRERLHMKLYASATTSLLNIDGVAPGDRVVGVEGVGGDKIYIINELSAEGVDIKWRRLAFGSSVDVTAVTDPERARQIGEPGGHIRAEGGYTRLPALEPIVLE